MTTTRAVVVTGSAVPTPTFQSRVGDVTALVAGGGVLYLTHRGAVRMALVPAKVGRDYLEHKQPTPPDDDLADGACLPTRTFMRCREAVMFFVLKGGVVFLTRNGRPRMAVVPEHVGREYEASQKADRDQGRDEC